MLCRKLKIGSYLFVYAFSFGANTVNLKDVNMNWESGLLL